MNATSLHLEPQERWRDHPALRRSYLRGGRGGADALAEALARAPLAPDADPAQFDVPTTIVPRIPAELPHLRSIYLGERAKSLTGALHARPMALPVGWVLREPDGKHAALEEATLGWRYLQSRRYRERAAYARTELRDTVERYEVVLGPLLPSEADDADRAMREMVRGMVARGTLTGEQADQIAKDDIAVRWALRYGQGAAAGMVDQIRALETRAIWNERRGAAQPVRFDAIRSCGEKNLKVTCVSCAGATHEAIPCRCGVVRVCKACADHRAAHRRSRIAKARVVALGKADGRGLRLRHRFGGAMSEKMLTLTLPHFCIENVDPESKLGRALDAPYLRTTVNARIAALRLAWPIFMRALRRHMKTADLHAFENFVYYRLFEWTRGHDGAGHPHFHVYLFSGFVAKALLREMWCKALTAIGVELPTSCRFCREGEESPSCGGLGAPHVIVDVRRLEGASFSALRELVKSGDRRAIETRLGHLRAPAAPGLDAIDYSSGWSMSDVFGELEDSADTDVKRDLYTALEGRRLAQGARGFLAAKAKLFCACGWSRFAAVVLTGLEAPKVDPETNDDAEADRYWHLHLGPPSCSPTAPTNP